MDVDPRALHLEGVSKSYGAVQALQPLSLVIEPGEMLALLGPSGCGKTTTLRVIAGFEHPDTGSVSIGGLDVTRVPPERRKLGMVFQNYSLFPHMTAGENVAFGLKMQRVGRAEMRRRVDEAFRTVRLDGLQDRFPRELSGGQQQRVALARSIVTQPGVLLLDEPLGALDRNLREGMQFELRQLQRQMRITSVLVTHDQEEALTIADRIAVMSDGRIRQIGTPAEVYDRPHDRFVAEFLGTANILTCEVVTGESGGTVVVRTEFGDQAATFGVPSTRPVSLGEKVLVAVRPENMHIERPSTAEQDETGLRLTISDHVFKGAMHAYQLRANGHDRPLVSYRQAMSNGPQATLAAGEPVIARWPANGAILLEDRL